MTHLASVAALLLALVPPVHAQEGGALVGPASSVAERPSVEALHTELRQLRDEMTRAINAGDIDGILKHVHPNVVFTAMNGESCRGADQVHAYFDRMLKGPNRIVEEMHTELQVDALTDLYGDTGVAYGSSNDHYRLRSGMDFQITNRWTCSLVRQDGRWLITSCHASANVFDNPVLTVAKKSVYRAGGGGGVLGILIGVVGGLLLSRSRRQKG